MPSEVEIANSALVKIGVSRIINLTDKGRAPETANAQYPIVRDALIESYRWNFALARVILAPDTTAPAFGFDSAFTLPTDSLAFLGVYDENEPLQNYTTTRIPHVIEGGKLLMDGTAANIFYVKRVTNVLLFPALFREALAYALAVDLAYALSTGLTRVESLTKEFTKTIRAARLADAIRGSTEISDASEWLESRVHLGRGPFRIGPVV